jgi:hypothetical protein
MPPWAYIFFSFFQNLLSSIILDYILPLTLIFVYLDLVIIVIIITLSCTVYFMHFFLFNRLLTILYNVHHMYSHDLSCPLRYSMLSIIVTLYVLFI